MFPRNDEKRAHEESVQAELDRLIALSPPAPAAEVLPALDGSTHWRITADGEQAVTADNVADRLTGVTS